MFQLHEHFNSLIRIRGISKNGARVQATLTIDLSTYCNLLLTKMRLTQHMASLSSLCKLPLAECDLSFAQIETELQEVSAAFEQLRKTFIIATRGFHGQLLWTDILTRFQKEFEKESSEKNTLACLLKNETKPLIFEAVCISFVELIKNSMDAMISRFISEGPCDAVVELTLSLWLTDDAKIAISFSDNGGGFSPSYLDEARQSLAQKHYLTYRSPLHQKDSSYYFGGQGMGLCSLYALFLDGIALNRGSFERQMYARASCVGNEISLKNTGNGAEVLLIGTQQCAILIEVNQSPETDDEPQEALALAPPPTHSNLTKKRPSLNLSLLNAFTTQTANDNQKGSAPSLSY